MNAIAGHVIKEASDVGASDAIIDPLYRSETMQSPILSDGPCDSNGTPLIVLWENAVQLLGQLEPPLCYSLQANCRCGGLVDLNDEHATIYFPAAYEVSKRLVDTPEKRSLIENALAKSVGRKVKIRLIHEGQASHIDPREKIRRELESAKEIRAIKAAAAIPKEVAPPSPLGQGEKFFVSHLKRNCESPIEEHFAKAWATLMQERYPYANTRFFFEQYGVIPERTDVTPLHVMQIDWICQQHPIDRYRVDFLLARVCRDAGDGVEVMRKLPPVVVECDGHDFHEKTKDQAQRDKSRDRKMTAMCYRVVRFTGSELHKDAMRCAKEVDELFRSLLNEQYRD